MAVDNLSKVLVYRKNLFLSYLLCNHLNKNHKSENDFGWDVFV